MQPTGTSTSHELLQRSKQPPVVIDKFSRELITHWHEWAQRFTRGESPEYWLHLYGFDRYERMNREQQLAGADIKQVGTAAGGSGHQAGSWRERTSSR